MDFRGGCCIARYAGGGGAYDSSKVDRIMLRFRPIAPKPVTCGGSTSPPESSAEVIVRSGRGKRKYSKESNKSNSGNSGSVTSNGNSNKRCKNKRREEKDVYVGGAVEAEVLTLPLLPEAPERKEFHPARFFTTPVEHKESRTSFWISFGDGDAAVGARHQTVASSSDLKESRKARTETVVSCVTVECITDTWIESQYGLGRTDEEKRANLERDTCPGLISDGLGRVTWTNGKYRELVGKGDKNLNMTVWLVMRERPMLKYTAFTCRVRLQYTCRNTEKSSITLPCDVWRMDNGGFAWRLDTNAALCLGW